MYEVRARGPYARSTLGVTIPVRLAKNDAKAIDKIAKQMGIPRSTFLRWCALYTAKALQEHIERVDAQRDYDEAKKKINSLDKQD